MWAASLNIKTISIEKKIKNKYLIESVPSGYTGDEVFSGYGMLIVLYL